MPKRQEVSVFSYIFFSGRHSPLPIAGACRTVLFVEPAICIVAEYPGASLGHAVGDKVISAVAARFQRGSSSRRRFCGGCGIASSASIWPTRRRRCATMRAWFGSGKIPTGCSTRIRDRLSARSRHSRPRGSRRTRIRQTTLDRIDPGGRQGADDEGEASSGCRRANAVPG